MCGTNRLEDYLCWSETKDKSEEVELFVLLPMFGLKGLLPPPQR